jgi:hypothetical protein
MTVNYAVAQLQISMNAAKRVHVQESRDQFSRNTNSFIFLDHALRVLCNVLMERASEDLKVQCDIKKTNFSVLGRVNSIFINAEKDKYGPLQA